MRLFLLLALLITAPLPAAEPADKKPAEPPAIRLTKEGERWAEKQLRAMSPEQKVGQLIMVMGLAEFQNVESPAFVQLRNDLKKYHLGSVLLTVRTEGGFVVRNQPLEAAAMTNALQREAEFPLIIAADFERGLSMRLLSTPAFPHAMAFGAAGDPALAERFGAVVAREARAIGVQWNFFPVADVNSNPLNPIINTRSFGEDPAQVGALLSAYIRGARANGLLTTAKHFPGHGDTDTDTHLALARINASRERLQAVDLRPFQDAIAAGVDAVMVAHISAPALDPDPDRVASVSPVILQDLLRRQMGFAGMVVPDAMNMKALSPLYKGDAALASRRAAVDAIRAGEDMVLLPSDLDGAYQGLLEAVRSGEIPMAELDSRVRKILRLKASVGLHRNRFVDLETVAREVGRPESFALAQEVAEASITLVRNEGQAMALLADEKRRAAGTSPANGAYPAAGEKGRSPSGTLALILTDDVRSEWGRGFERELRDRVPDAEVVYVDPRFAGSLLERVTASALNARVVVLAAYSIPVAGKQVSTKDGVMNSVALSAGVSGLVDRVLKVAGPRTVMVALGSPYLARDFPAVPAYLCTYSHAGASESAAVRALFGEIPLRGRLPVTIPGFADRGAGIQVPANGQK
jgi:beta-N-acetylhexosaminidase